ncbi:MAG: hypothetical protein A2798_00445 [Candidatus Levybacteria bacterium RIFCSPHIGHO2_01_FULL_37_17]|nr:MAG: hypothetical protein A2798_00445 [Candidatus Levybacteria bacterium RIFCSPHIGHO2_01_FULL_37_17]OGH36444.1 MAG: hypothetical protein A2959_02920 [Candidatus Levybacteria bacterium RIFCSPLOWO2_01_FULL_38_23]
MPSINWASCAYNSSNNPDALGAASLSCLPMIFGVIVFWTLVFAGIVALVILIYTGYKFLTSGGDPKSADAARKTFTYGLLGFILIMVSFLIINVIAEVTGVSCIKNFDFQSCLP